MLTLTDHTPTDTESTGGTQINVTGDFSTFQGQEFRIHVGVNGDATDPVCYSGVPSRGSILFPLNDTTLRAYLPNLVPSQTKYKIFVSLADASQDGVINDAIRIYPADFKNQVFAYRSILPSFYHLGPRNFDALPEVVPFP